MGCGVGQAGVTNRIGQQGVKSLWIWLLLVNQEQWVPRHRPLILCGWAWEGWGLVNLKVKLVILSVLPTQDPKPSRSFGTLSKFQMGQCQCVWDPPSHTYHLSQNVTFSPQWTTGRLEPGRLHRISPGGSGWAPFSELFLKAKFGSVVPGLRPGEIIPASYELRTYHNLPWVLQVTYFANICACYLI